MGNMTTNMIGTKSAAYQAGLEGLPEPAIKTKRVREHDPVKGWKDGEKVWVTATVETLASMRARQLWRRGCKTRELRADTRSEGEGK